MGIFETIKDWLLTDDVIREKRAKLKRVNEMALERIRRAPTIPTEAEQQRITDWQKPHKTASEVLNPPCVGDE